MSFWQEEKGNVMIIFALALTALLGVGAIVVDVGLLYAARTDLVNTADAAALAGVALLPGDPEQAIAVAENFAGQNGVEADQCTATISQNNTRITVVVNRQVNFSFARIFGLTSQNVSARAVAEVNPLASATGVIPLAVERQQFTFGVLYTLKEGGGSGYCGNYGALALGGTGANNYKDNIIDGYEGTLHVGDWVSTEPGNMSGPTSTGVNTRISNCTHGCSYDDYVQDCSRVVTIPIVDSLDVHGRKDVLIVGFARFFLKGVGGSGNKNYVEGYFLEELADGEGGDGAQDFGLRSTRLIE